MGNHFDKHRYRHQFDRRRRQTHEAQPSLIDEVADLVLLGIAGACRQLVRLGRWFLRLPAPLQNSNADSSSLRVFRNRRRGWDKKSRHKRIRDTLRQWAQRAPVPYNAREQMLPPPMPYRRAQCLLSKGERALWYTLYRAVKGKYRVFCKVRLADVVQAPTSDPQERRWFRKIGRFHVDFVLCEPQTTAPVLVVELDDRSHRSPARYKRDRFKDEVLQAAGVPIYRVRACAAYDVAELRVVIDRMIIEAQGR